MTLHQSERWQRRFAFAIAIALTLFAGASAGGTVEAESAIHLATTPAPLEESWSIDWWIPRHEARLAERHAGIDVVMIGDSITERWEKEGAPVWQKHFGHLDTLNLGFGGDRTENVLWRLQHGAVDELDPDLVVLLIGTNNAGFRRDPPEAVAAGVEAILRELQDRLPDSAILLFAIFPGGEAADDAHLRLNAASNQLLRQVAAKAGVLYADIGDALVGQSGLVDPGIMPDGIHLSETGYEIWARQLAAWFERYVPAY